MAQQAPVEWRDKIVHATLNVGATVLHGGDAAPGSYETPQGFQLQLNLDDATAAERLFSRLAEGGQVTVPLQQTFWAKEFGAVVDRFGIPWAINCGERLIRTLCALAATRSTERGVMQVALMRVR